MQKIACKKHLEWQLQTFKTTEQKLEMILNNQILTYAANPVLIKDIH